MATKWHFAQKLEIWWWKKYLDRKVPSEYLSKKQVYWHKILDLTGISPGSGVRILDAGCGPAGIFTVLGHCAVDALDPLLEQYERKLPIFKRRDYPHTRFIPQKLEDFIARDSYETVFCFNAINHVDDIQKGIDVLTKVVAPTGNLVVSVDTHRNRLLKWLFRIAPADALHPHQYDRDEYVQFFEQRGFHIVRETVLRKELIFEYRLWVFRRHTDPKTQ
jgi:SAM-dependent methyltransferase